MKIKHFLMDQAGDGAGGGGTPPAAPWYQGVDGLDAELTGHITSKGWDKMTPQQAAIAAAKAHREAQHYIGVPQDQLLRLPKDQNDEAGWKAVHARMGVPNEPKDYDLSNVKFKDGTPLDDGFANFFRGVAHKYHVGKNDAAGLAAEFAGFLENAEQQEATEAAGKLAAEKTELAKSWGPNFEANKFVAQRAANALGIDPDTVAALEKVAGYSKVMEMFRQIGARIGEDKFVNSTAPGGNAGPMTKEEALAQRESLKKDPEWTKRYLNGGAAERRQMEALNRMIAGS